MKLTSKLPVLFLAAIASTLNAADEKAAFYKEPDALFSTRPSASEAIQTINRFGPVGIGIDLLQPAFVMRIQNVEAGSPAAATGKLKVGQFIDTINGAKLADIDPRMQLADILDDAEAKDGSIRLLVKDNATATAEEVIVKIPVLGAYSKTWPLNDPKSNKIVRAYGDFLATKPSGGEAQEGFQLLFLLSTGEAKDLDTARKWVADMVTRFQKTKSANSMAWFIGLAGVPLCEYYLRTGDASALPILQAYADHAKKGQTLDGWAARDAQAAVTYGGGGGHLNAAGTATLTFLLLAKECGVNVDEPTLHRGLTHFYRFAGRGNNPYGDNRPETGFVDNGKNGNLAFAMAAAAALTPDGENSLYARARDTCALSGFYTSSFMLHGHTGGGIGEVWRSAAMGLLHDKAPHHYREFMDNRRWIYELSRRYTGSFGLVGGARYDDENWGAGLALTYTIPRKTLRIAGAPKTAFAKEFKLPARPWGVAADDAFESIEPVKDGLDLRGETFAQDSAIAVLRRIAKAPEMSDADVLKIARHPDNEIRKLGMRKIMGINSGYLGSKGGGGKVRMELLLELLKAKDARLRQGAIDAFMFNPVKPFPPEVAELLLAMLKDPSESWWVKDHALRALASAPADMLAAQVDVILPYLKHQEWWLQNAALSALTPVVADTRCYQKVLPAIGEMLRTCQRYNAVGPVGGINGQLAKASPEVQKLAKQTLSGVYEGYAGPRKAEGGQDITKAYESQLKFLAASLAAHEGGYDALYAMAKQRFPNDPLPYREIFLKADPAKFGPELKNALKPIVRDQLVYEFMGKNRANLEKEAKWEPDPKGAKFAVGALDGLAELYRQAGIHDYDWHLFGPERTAIKWEYFSFAPQETRLEKGWRYRKVTYPAGMENWAAPNFDAAKAGWQSGLAPFGQEGGKLRVTKGGCKFAFCGCGEPMHTLWDKEVLLLRSTLEVPPLKPGFRYRLLIGGSSHVGAGDGLAIYLNGKLANEQTSGVDKREGAQPRGMFIDHKLASELQSGKVTVAVAAFQQGKAFLTVWLEEMKMPPLDTESFQKSATLIPMLSADWQSRQDPLNPDPQDDDEKFRYDGKFAANPKLLGTWTTIDQVAAAEDFNPERKMNPGRPPFKSITFKDKGLTDDGLWLWSGDTLMDLARYQALKLTLKTIDNIDYLFIEAGGFSPKNPVGWQPPLLVLKR